MEEYTALATWLDTVTRKLSTESAARVREELLDHYALAHEEALDAGANADEAFRSALDSLGDAKAVNRAYRKVLLTAREAQDLDSIANTWTRPWAKVVVLFVVAVFLVEGLYLQDVQMIFGWAGGLILAAGLFFFPPRTRGGGRIYRYARWALMGGIAVTMSQWLTLIGLLVFWALTLVPFEWRRMNLRRKLPVEKWPRGLFM